MSNLVENDFINKLRNKALENGIDLNEEILKKLEIYKKMVVEWNEKINLTAITDDDGIILKHLVDSLECVKHINKDSRVIDVGTGAGFPGVVIAIYFDSNIELTLLDALNKRTVFLEEVVKTLGLKNVNVVHERAEEAANLTKYREKYDYVVARAVAALNILLEYTVPYSKVGGKCLLMKGDKVQEEIDLSKNALKTLNCKIDKVEEYKLKDTINNEVYNRSIVVVSKGSVTPVGYPRNFGRIKNKPL